MGMFHDLQDAFKPLYAPESRSENYAFFGEIPPEILKMDESAEELEYKGRSFKMKKVNWGIREDGPGAWGCGLTIEDGVLFRWHPGGNDWYLSTKRQYITIASGGKSLETIQLHDDDTISWTMNIFEAI